MLALEGLPPTPVAAWFNPRSGASTPIQLVADGKTCHVPSPQAADGVLILRGEKR